MFLILFLATKYILPPLNKAMETRQEKIRASLEAADVAKRRSRGGRRRASATSSPRRATRRERSWRPPRRPSDQVKAEAAGRAQAEYDRIVVAASADVDTARQRAIDEASARIGEIVFELVTKIVGREVDAEHAPRPRSRGGRRAQRRSRQGTV